MTNENKILEALRRIGKNPASSFPAVVKAIYQDKDYCDCVDLNGVLYEDVRLRAAIGNHQEGIVIRPAVDSSVILSRLDNSDELFVSMFSAVDSIVIDGGSNGGLVITPELRTQLGKLTARVDGIMDAINNGVPGSADGGAALLTSIKTGLATITDVEDFTAIENEKIKH